MLRNELQFYVPKEQDVEQVQDWIREFLIQLEKVEAFYLKNLFELRVEFENIKKQVKAKTDNLIYELERESVKASESFRS